ncbi:FAD:protein FMN transferase [Alkalitalea saponilacus]|uniref:FAD:protein FMN transferase n=1 Tax=Alkalitalea saponilacus TaxID=889453 RepID=A0A1T5BPH8_9BACT|nr:FAD:protein FMN transferase [Alkalitalea saponilacus]ASB49641.1 thiamine biosynthesis protein ApbE [Alkalitalea saponilacus]SKB48810.1 thiamine biosynthesis lipoprotein [Alkalitalea saponilacus]
MRILFFVAVSFLFLACELEKEYHVNGGRIFGTSYRIVYESSEDHHNEIHSLLDSFNRSLSTYDSTSIISRINRCEEGVVPDPFFKKVFRTAQMVTAQTNGAFDMTVAPLVNAWGFGFQKMADVTPELVDSLLQFVGMHHIDIINGKVVKKIPGVMLDGGAIAKGYGVDVVASHLASLGVKNYMVEIGGEVATRGHNPQGNFWRIGIDRPIDDPLVLERKTELIVHLSGESLATSGNYRNFYIRDGKKYAHTIDPRTGYPVSHNLLSATIIAPNCMLADAYATACMVIGLEESIELIERLTDVEACFIIDSDGEYEVIYSSGFHQLLR